MPAKESLVGEASSDLASDRDVGEEHELQERDQRLVAQAKRKQAHLLDELVGLLANEGSAIVGEALGVETESDLDVVNRERAILEPASTKLASDALRWQSELVKSERRQRGGTHGETEDVSFDVVAVLSFPDFRVGNGSAVDNCLGIAVRKLDGRAAEKEPSAPSPNPPRTKTHLMMVFPNQVETIRPSAVMVKTTLKVSLSWPGLRLQSSSLRV